MTYITHFSTPMHILPLNRGRTLRLLLINALAIAVAVALLPSSVQASGLNNHGSSMCFGHHNQLQSLIRQLEEVPYRDLVTFSGSGKWESVGCITFSDLLPVAVLGSLVPAALVFLGTSFETNRANFDGALCAFYQGTRGGVFTLQRTIDSLKTLADPAKGNANPCGSIPINWPLNNDTGGELTMNYVAGAPCDGPCLGNKDLAAPADKALKNDHQYDYAPGWCGVHVTWYATTASIHDNYFDLALRDANQVLVGAVYYVRAPRDTPVPVASKLPWNFNVTAVRVSPDQSQNPKTLPSSSSAAWFKMTYPGTAWDSSSKQCVCDEEFQDGFISCNCGFTCGTALGLLNPS